MSWEKTSRRDPATPPGDTLGRRVASSRSTSEGTVVARDGGAGW